jgi:predicted nucleic acid-binding protein
MSVRSFVDTNVLVYRFDRGEPAKRAVAKRLLDKALPGTLVISTQVLQEFYVVMTRKLATPLRPAQASEAVEELGALPVVGVDVDFVRSGIEISRRHDLSLWDALIVQAAVAAQCDRILSEDLADGATIEGVRVDNPFRGVAPRN